MQLRVCQVDVELWSMSDQRADPSQRSRTSSYSLSDKPDIKAYRRLTLQFLHSELLMTRGLDQEDLHAIGRLQCNILTLTCAETLQQIRALMPALYVNPCTLCPRSSRAMSCISPLMTSQLTGCSRLALCQISEPYESPRTHKVNRTVNK